MLDRQTAAPEMKTTVVCRLAGEAKVFFGTAAVLAVLFPLCIAAGALTSPGFFWSNAFLLLLLGTVCIVPLGLVCAICLVKSCIIADKHGVRWRKAGRWRSALWEDVTAKFETTGSSSSSGNNTFVTMKAPSGILVI